MSLPEDLITEILSRLPVKSLLRFKSVCKSWSTIIADPIFISKHHHHARHSDVALIGRRDNITNRRVISLLAATDDHSDTLLDLNLPTFLNEMFGHVRLIGPCNGVVCLYGFPDNIALWNPSIRDFRRLPQSRAPRPPNSKVRGGDLGVGFDPKSRDFKVLQMLFCVSADCRIISQVEIYELRSNSWRIYDRNVPADIIYDNISSMVFQNGTFCWWARDRGANAEVILSFDFSKEVFETTPLPPEIEGLGGDRRITRAILPMGPSVALIVYGQKDADKVFDVWSVRELGAGSGECWSRMMSVGPVSRVEKPLGFWKDGGFFLENSDGEMVVYDRVDRKMKRFGVYGKRSRLEVIVLKESLFSVSEVDGVSE